MQFSGRKWRLLLLCLFFHTPVVLAQTDHPMATLDSLLNLYDASDSKTRVSAGQQILSFCSQQNVFFGEAPVLDDKQTARQQNLCVWFAAERYLTTNSYYKEALQYIDKSLALLPQKPHETQPSTLNSQPSARPEGTLDASRTLNLHETLLCDRAYCLYKTSDYTAAIEAGREAMHLCQQTGNTLQLSRAYLYLSLVNHALRKYDVATTLVVKAIETNEEAGDHQQLHNALGIACELFCSAGDVDKAIEFGQRAVEEARQQGYMPGVANHLTQLAYAYDRKGDYALGLQVANEAIDIVKAQEPLDRNQLALTLEYKSWNLIDIGRHAEAVEALREAIRLEEEVGNTHAAWNDLRTLSEAMTPIDPRGAVDVLKRYVHMSDSIHNEQLKALMSQANAEFHNDELQAANDKVRRMNRIILWTAVAVLLLLAAVIVSLTFAFRQKRRTAQTLERMTAAREAFFTNVTHEFRTPLTVILGIGRELKQVESSKFNVESSKLKVESSKSFDPTGTFNSQLSTFNLQAMGEAIERQGSRLLTLVNQLLDISKVTSAIGTPQQTQGDVAAYVGMVVEAQREVARQKGISIDYATDPDGITATFASDYVEKVVGNLLSNAVKFTPEGGHVDIGLHLRGKMLELTVTDTGPGIPAADLPHIFEPFYRAGNANEQGSGVGLALVKQIVESLHGEIEVKSEVGEGTTFTVKLPKTPQTPRSQQPQPQQTPSQQTHPLASPCEGKTHPLAPPCEGKTHPLAPPCEGGERLLLTAEGQTASQVHSAPLPHREGQGGGSVGAGPVGGGPEPAESSPSLLIVEDNPDVAHLIAHQLEGRYTIHFAADGDEGIGQARMLVPDLIITDLMMPHTDGLELCRILRADPTTNHIPIIVITAKATEQDRIQGLQAGADAYLYKPFNAEELNVRIEKLLEQRRMLQEKYIGTTQKTPSDPLSVPPKGGEWSPASSDTQIGPRLHTTEEEDDLHQTAEKITAFQIHATLPLEGERGGGLGLSGSFPFTSHSAEFIDRVRDAILRQMSQGNMDVDSIAAELCLSPSQLRRKMNAITGMPPKKFIMKVRMDAANEMMRQHPDMKLSDIAEKCGFYDLSHFIRLYKEAYGTTPAAEHRK